MLKRQISCVICFIVALLTALSFVPAVLHFWICDFSAQCFADVLWHLVISRAAFRTAAIATVFAPPFFLLLYFLAFRNCQRPTDVLDRSRHPSF
jgi:hypothetical protein